MKIDNTDRRERKLVKRIVCPNCWARFSPEEILFVARHPDLIGDPVIGSNEFLRFSPMRFNLDGDALDDREAPTSTMACPHCHLEIHEQLLEIAPLFISLVGAPGAGKSYFLTSMIWCLRNTMPQFKLQFIDSDPFANSVIADYENLLFMNPDPESPTQIPKTQADDPRLYRMVMRKDVPVRCPSPIQFTTRLARTHPRYRQGHRNGRAIVLYDNAGEDYLPQSEDFSSVATRHLAKSNICFMLFDLTQDPRFARFCTDDRLRTAKQPIRQESILRNVALQIRRYSGLPDQARVKAPLVVIVPKFDAYRGIDGIDITSEPFIQNSEGGLSLDTARIERYSARLHTLFEEICPELNTCADDITSTVVYIPVSSLGTPPQFIREAGREFYGIQPSQVHPRWATIPLLYSLCKWATGIIPAAGSSRQED